MCQGGKSQLLATTVWASYHHTQGLWWKQEDSAEPHTFFVGCSLCGSKLVILPAPKGTVPGSYCWWPVLRAAILQWLYHPEHSWSHLITATPQLVVVLSLLPMLPRPPSLASTATWKDKVLNVPIRPPSKRPSPGSKKKKSVNPEEKICKDHMNQ